MSAHPIARWSRIFSKERPETEHFSTYLFLKSKEWNNLKASPTQRQTVEGNAIGQVSRQQPQKMQAH